MELIAFILLAYVVLYAFARIIPPLPLLRYREQAPLQSLPNNEGAEASEASLDTWLKKEQDIALDRLLANVAPGGRNVPDAAAGSVIASPSKEYPNYYYQWVRDAAITAGALVDIYSEDSYSNLSSKLTSILDTYTSLTYRIQHTDNPSGIFKDLSGLGEPKFHADGSAFKGSWGRPQRDGPALRALTLIKYLRAYNASHPGVWSSPTADDWFKPLYRASMPADSVIKADLEYISRYWDRSGFDVWEEVNGMHFFTLMVTHRALREGADIATVFADDGAARWYKFQAAELEKFMPKFWDEDKNHLVATLDSSRAGLDCSLLLGSLHGTPINSSASNDLFPPHSDELLLSLLALVKDQAERFPINSVPRSPEMEGEGRPKPLAGAGIGRYPEDVYDGYGNIPNGGNPWFLCTSASAQVLYTTAQHLLKTEQITVSQLGLPFYSALLSPSSSFELLKANATYCLGDEVFDEIVRRLKEVGDQFLDVVKTHADAEGSLSEQFDRVTGYMRGARDLTWSYGAFLQAHRTRQRLESKL